MQDFLTPCNCVPCTQWKINSQAASKKQKIKNTKNKKNKTKQENKNKNAVFRVYFQRFWVNCYDRDWMWVFLNVYPGDSNAQELWRVWNFTLRAKKLVCHSFKDAGIKHEIPLSEMKDSLLLIEISVARVSACVCMCVCERALVPWILIPIGWYKEGQMTSVHIVDFITREDPWV